MALTFPQATLLHAALATVSDEVVAIDQLALTPTRLPPELLLIIRSHLLVAVTTQLFFDSTRALAEYETDLQRLLCPDCISYNHDIYGPDVWQWQHFFGPCACIQTNPDDLLIKSIPNPRRFSDPYHWLDHHLSLQASRLTSPSSTLSIWDVVTDVLHQSHCEPLREHVVDSPTTVHGRSFPPDSINAFYHRRVVHYYNTFKRPQSPPVVSIRPLPSALQFYESRGIGDAGEIGDAFRTQVILRQFVRKLGLDGLELGDAFNSHKDSTRLASLAPPPRHNAPDAPMCLHLYTSPVFQGAIKTCSFLSAVLGAFVSMPMTIATIALTVICFYSRPVALRVGA